MSQLLSNEEIQAKYPLHFLVWNNNYNALDELLQQKKHDIEQVDLRGRTPLMLAVVMDHLESARVLLRHSANVFASRNYWSIYQEAVSTGDPQLLKLILLNRDTQLVQRQVRIMNDLLAQLRSTPDFYVEMKWEFTSWLPLVSLMCPSDVCRVWKRGPNVRIDTTLIGFNGATSWERGQLTYIFRVTKSGAVMDEINHTDRTIYRHQITRGGGGPGASPSMDDDDCDEGGGAGAAAQLFVREPTEAAIAGKLTQPTFVTYLDTDKIEFEKSKAGIWGWRSDRKETVNKHDCQVYCASNVQIVTLRRTEHLTEENLASLNQQRGGQRGRVDSSAPEILFPGGQGNLLTNLLQTTAGERESVVKLDSSHEAASYNPDEVAINQYFSSTPNVHSTSDIGRPKVMTTKVKTFKARLWLCPDYPMSLKDQIVPIIDLMSEYNPYFHKLKEFLTKQLPSGFPVKIEIPLYHVLNACISFGNLYGEDSEVYGVKRVEESKQAGTTSPATSTQPLLSSSVSCVVDESVFDVGKDYHVVFENSPGHYGALYDEEQMVQMAVQRSLVEYGTPDELLNREYSLSVDVLNSLLTVGNEQKRFEMDNLNETTQPQKMKVVEEKERCVRIVVDSNWGGVIERKKAIVEARPDAYVEPEEAWLQKAIADSLTVEEGSELLVDQSDAAFAKVLEESRALKAQDDERRKQEEEELARVLELSTRDK